MNDLTNTLVGGNTISPVYGVPLSVKLLHRDAKLPVYSTLGAAGADIHAVFDDGIERVVIEPGARALIMSGLAVAIPRGFEIQVRPRSGLALKSGITIVNAPGTVDSDFRGEIGAILLNTGEGYFTVNSGDRIAQIVLAPVYQARFEMAEELPETDRGTGGFGSTGV